MVTEGMENQTNDRGSVSRLLRSFKLEDRCNPRIHKKYKVGNENQTILSTEEEGEALQAPRRIEEKTRINSRESLRSLRYWRIKSSLQQDATDEGGNNRLMQ